METVASFVPNSESNFFLGPFICSRISVMLFPRGFKLTKTKFFLKVDLYSYKNNVEVIKETKIERKVGKTKKWMSAVCGEI